VQEETVTRLVGVPVEVVDAHGVERRCATDEAVDLVALRQKKLREVGAVLPGDSGDHRTLRAGVFGHAAIRSVRFLVLGQCTGDMELRFKRPCVAARATSPRASGATDRCASRGGPPGTWPGGRTDSQRASRACAMRSSHGPAGYRPGRAPPRVRTRGSRA